MRTSLFAAVLIVASPAFANEPAALIEPSFSSVNQPGEQVAPGDFVAMSQGFEAWATICEYRISTSRRVCRVQQTLVSSGKSLRWMIAPTSDGKNAVRISISGERPVGDSFTISFADFKRVVPGAAWRCANGECSTVFVYDTAFQTLVMQPGMKFSYREGTADKSTAVEFPARLQGFTAAAAATAPGNDLLGLASRTSKAPDVAPKPPVRTAARKSATNLPADVR
jgi:invasion protein IalB